MVTRVKIKDKNPNEVMDIVKDLRDQRLIQGTDFDFAYFQSQYDPISGHFIEGKHTVFTFYIEKYATWFALKYSEYL